MSNGSYQILMPGQGEIKVRSTPPDGHEHILAIVGWAVICAEGEERRIEAVVPVQDNSGRAMPISEALALGSALFNESSDSVYEIFSLRTW